MENQSLVAQQQNLPTFNFFNLDQFETIQRIAKLFIASDLVPDIYKVSDKNTLEKALSNTIIALEVSARLNASPLMIMQNLNIVMGKPSFSSKFLIASVNSCGKFEPLKFKYIEKGLLGKVDYTEYVWDDTLRRKVQKTAVFDGTKIQDVECICYTNKIGSTEMLEGNPVSIRTAVLEGWMQKNGSKWQTMPKLMLTYRAASFWVSIHAAEIGMGIKTIEEIHDIEEINYEDVTSRVEKMISDNKTKKELGFASHEPEQKPETSNPKPESKPEPEPKPETSNPKPETKQESKPETSNPKPETRNVKSETPEIAF
jgi:hypothetical protein